MYKTKNIKVKAVEYTGDNVSELTKHAGEVFTAIPPRVNNIETKLIATIGRQKINVNKGDMLVIINKKWMIMNRRIFDELFEGEENETIR